MLLALFVALILTLLYISPFFLLRKLKNITVFLLLSSISSLAIFIFCQRWPYNFVLKKFVVTYDQLDFFDNVTMWAIYIYVLFMIFSPFFFTKIIRGRIGVKYFFISSALSVVIFFALFYFYAYGLFPMAGSVLLENI